MVPTKIPGLYTFQTLAHKSKFENHHPQRFLRNELQSLQPWGLFNLSGMFSKLSYSAWFSSSRLVSPPRALGLCMCQMRILWFHVKPSVRKAYIFKEYMNENKSLFFYTLEIFSFGGVECRKSKYPLERLASVLHSSPLVLGESSSRWKKEDLLIKTSYLVLRRFLVQ